MMSASTLLNEDCVCGDSISNGIILECHHQYHEECLIRMMRETCAYCRQHSAILQRSVDQQIEKTWHYLLTEGVALMEDAPSLID